MLVILMFDFSESSSYAGSSSSESVAMVEMKKTAERGKKQAKQLRIRSKRDKDSKDDCESTEIGLGMFGLLPVDSLRQIFSYLTLRETIRLRVLSHAFCALLSGSVHFPRENAKRNAFFRLILWQSLNRTSQRRNNR